MVIDHLAERGVLDTDLLYESPFTDLAPRCPDGLSAPRQVGQLVGVLATMRTSAKAG